MKFTFWYDIRSFFPSLFFLNHLFLRDIFELAFFTRIRISFCLFGRWTRRHFLYLSKMTALVRKERDAVRKRKLGQSRDEIGTPQFANTRGYYRDWRGKSYRSVFKPVQGAYDRPKRPRYDIYSDTRSIWSDA